MDDATELVHGTCVALGRAAALVRGPSGSGKSDLALRFLFLARRGPAALEPPTLVADDQVLVRRRGNRLLVEAPATLRGKLEVRGVGIVEVKAAVAAELVLVADLVGETEVERHPDAATTTVLGVEVAAIRLMAREASAPIKLALALARARQT